MAFVIRVHFAQKPVHKSAQDTVHPRIWNSTEIPTNCKSGAAPEFAETNKRLGAPSLISLLLMDGQRTMQVVR